jgi:hypothetical protein
MNPTTRSRFIIGIRPQEPRISINYGPLKTLPQTLILLFQKAREHALLNTI